FIFAKMGLLPYEKMVQESNLFRWWQYLKVMNRGITCHIGFISKISRMIFWRLWQKLVMAQRKSLYYKPFL
ncbi:hypothetical protein ACI394_29100, partial [Klebsiella pneumoniae]|uniref:hypothetical protein n=1 Tax=Klebsiella pneumoniae TaxID=573 RepID=UPI0038523BC1